MLNCLQDLLIVIFATSMINLIFLVFITKTICKLKYDISKQLDNTEKDIEESFVTTVKEIELKRRTDEVNKKFKLKRSKIARIIKQIWCKIIGD